MSSMDRKNFIKKMGAGAGAVFFLTCMGSCSGSGSDDDPAPSNNNPGSPTKVDFTFDVTTDASLKDNGWVIRNNIIIAKSGDNFLAFQSTCTHQGASLTFNKANNTFPCSLQGAGHGSVFNESGARVAGAASMNLKKYNTTLTGNNLRVFE
jgi:Rieske Fe-S protein